MKKEGMAISCNLVKTKKFMDMSVDAQLLYFHLSVYATKDGIVECKDISYCEKSLDLIDDSAIEELVQNDFAHKYKKGLYQLEIGER